MSLSLNKEMNMVIQIRLIATGSDQPLNGEEYKVRLYDKDVVNDDFLGESGVTNGLATFTISREMFSGFLHLEEKPDIFFVVFKNGNKIFESEAMADMEISDLQQFVMNEGEVIDLGTFLVDPNLH